MKNEITFGKPIDLFPALTERQTMSISRQARAAGYAPVAPAPKPAPAAPAPAAAPPAPPVTSDPASAAKLAQIASALGVDPNDEQALRAAFEALFAPIAEARALARRGMTGRELRLCREKGIDVVKYAATRAAIRDRGR